MDQDRIEALMAEQFAPEKRRPLQINIAYIPTDLFRRLPWAAGDGNQRDELFPHA